MSNGIKFVFLLSVILIVMFSMTFAQDVPFNAEVIVETARMRWGPGPAYTVQHYANLGHVLTILEADTESNPPWTWYRARTPSGVESWIRGDLIRRATGAAARVDMPTGAYPELENNLCNTAIFRRCQDGTDHDLWQAGYWANDRYDHWETGGWDLNIVYHNNPCKSDRLCTTREDWDAGAQEAALIVASLTPEATVTPVVIRVTSEVEVATTWQTLVLTGSSVPLVGTTTVDLYNPSFELKTGTGATETIIGGFRFNSESVRVTCQYWHNADLAPGVEPVESSKFTVSSFRAEEDADKVNCISGNVQESNVTARQWEITLTRSYSGLGRITGISWTATATVRADGGTTTMVAELQAYLENVRTDFTKRDLTISTNPYGVELPLHASLINTACSGRRTPPAGEDEQNVIRYEYTCDDRNADTDVGSTLKFNFTHDRTRGFLRPTATPNS
ncbi:MAG: SH3 domain-containing protein [Chloroflexota bacterium]|nr:SH3 domain-containing protein [Chloroflexota bacterium]